MLKRNTLVATAILLCNLVIGLGAPTTLSLDDEIAALDGLWRTVQGQRLGIDYHDPLGFGPSQLGAVLWHWFGAHAFILRLSAFFIGLAISLCACLVAEWKLRDKPRESLLFCVLVAVVVSGPSVFGARTTDIGMSEYFNRLIVGALAVVFLQSYGDEPVGRDDWKGIVLAGFLLSLLAAVKVSGAVIGVGLMTAACLRNQIPRRLVTAAAALVVGAALFWIELRLSGLGIQPLLHETQLAAAARLAFTPADFASAILNWPTAAAIVSLGLYAYLLRSGRPECRSWPLLLVIGAYSIAQVALNLTNSRAAMIVLAPVAALALAGCAASSARTRTVVIPAFLFLFVIAPEIAGSLVGAGDAIAVATGVRRPVILSGGRGFELKAVAIGHISEALRYARTLDPGVKAIRAIGGENATIASLDYANPFPILFQSPSPRGGHGWFDVGFTYPAGAHLDWRDVIGDACIVMIPHRPNIPGTVTLYDAVKEKLNADFEIVFSDASWTAWEEKMPASAPSRPGCAGLRRKL